MRKYDASRLSVNCSMQIANANGLGLIVVPGGGMGGGGSPERETYNTVRNGMNNAARASRTHGLDINYT